ncbi:MAG: ATP-dependent RecD-like DNA helicase [Clostridia bacterium]|nr:ATP-dependent RecD-like DNA helicase [Clostridia bacterium]
MDEEQIEGTVEEVIFENESTGYRVFTVDCEGTEIVAVGTCVSIYPGELINAVGSWSDHATYGRQFICTEIEKSFPGELVGITKFLVSGAVKGIGPATARKIVMLFGEDSFDILEHEPLQLTKIKGISKEKALKLSDAFRETVGTRETLMTLHEMGITPTFAVKVAREYGANAPRIVQENPYRLWEEIEGFTFQTADNLALSMGIGAADELRVGYCVKYILAHNLQNGHCFLPKDKLLPLGAQYVDITEEEVEIAIENMCERHQLELAMIGGREVVYLPNYYKAETRAAEKLKLMLQFGRQEIRNVEDRIKKSENKLGIFYEYNQREAIRTAVENRVMVLTGGPGTGKTTTLRGMIYLFEALKYDVLLCAPTGRAAKRMSQVCDRKAQTIHRMLEVQPGSGAFTHNGSNPLKCDVMIVDEMSMVDSLLFEALLEALPLGCRLIMVGDADQLPSVGAGNVLYDLVRSGALPTVSLTEIFRQAKKSTIVTTAHEINEGVRPDLENKNDLFFIAKKTPEGVLEAAVEMAVNRIPRRYGYDVMDGLQVIIPTKKTYTGTVNVNTVIRDRVNPDQPGKRTVTFRDQVFREGDKVMQIRNNYDLPVITSEGLEEAGVFNGDIGIITQILPREKQVKVQFEDRVATYENSQLDELEPAYAITVHKSQGSEFEAVVLILGDMTPLLQYRNLLYTAVTRAKKLLVIVGSRQVVDRMVGNNKHTNRYSGLRYLLQGR